MNSLEVQSEQFDQAILRIEDEVYQFVRSVIIRIEEELILEYSSASDLISTGKRFESLSNDIAHLFEILPDSIHNRLVAFPYWVHRNFNFDILGEWSRISKEANVLVLSQIFMADLLKEEIAAIIGLAGDILMAHAFTQLPRMQALELPQKSGTLFAVYKGECCYARDMELPDSLLASLAEYAFLAADLADESRRSENTRRENNSAELREARDRGRAPREGLN